MKMLNESKLFVSFVLNSLLVLAFKRITIFALIALPWSTCSYGQYCLSGGPLSGSDSHISQVFLAGEDGTALDYVVGCTGAVGVIDQTILSVDLGVGASYSLVINFNSCGGFYASDGEAWIDYDQDNIFETSESLGSWTGAPPSLSTMNFTVPTDALYGVSRMRVMLHEDLSGSVSPPLNPCAAFNRGSVYDFTVVMVPWVDCSGLSGDGLSDAFEIGSIPYSDAQNTAECFTDQNSAYSSPDAFYRILGSDIGVASLDISTCGSSFDTYLTVLNGSGEVVDFNDDSPDCSPHSELNVPISEEDTLFVVVEGWGTLEGVYELSIEEGADVSTMELSANDFKLYPNPVQENQFSLETNYNGTMTLSDMRGTVIMEKNFSSGSNHFDLPDLENGVYSVNFSTNHHQTTKKILIQR